VSQDDITTSEGVKKASAVALRILDALLVRNPERTAVGVAIGFGIDGVLGVFQPLMVSRGLDLSRFEWWASVCLGLVLVHLPFVVWSVRHKPLISDELESLIKLIERTNIGELEKRTAYRRVVNKCIDEFSLRSKPATIKRIVEAELEGTGDRVD
jgi:hypothetical protein